MAVRISNPTFALLDAQAAHPHQETFSLASLGPSSEPLREEGFFFSAAERPTIEPSDARENV
jgi:hypothetical protein